MQNAITVAKLTKREIEILSWRFGIDGSPNSVPRSLDKCSEKFHITRERARQIESRALRKIDNASGLDIATFEECESLGELRGLLAFAHSVATTFKYSNTVRLLDKTPTM